VKSTLQEEKLGTYENGSRGLTRRHSRINHNLAELICGDPKLDKFPENIPEIGKLDREPTAICPDCIWEDLQKKRLSAPHWRGFPVPPRFC
jgi:hypothetical protein